MLRVQIRPRFPQLGKEFLAERFAKIRDAFRAARAALVSHHALDHLNMMRAPEREVLVMLD